MPRFEGRGRSRLPRRRKFSDDADPTPSDQAVNRQFDVEIDLDLTGTSQRSQKSRPAESPHHVERVDNAGPPERAVSAGELASAAAASPAETEAPEVIKVDSNDSDPRAEAHLEVGPNIAVSEVSGPVRVERIVVGNPSPDVEPKVVRDNFKSFPYCPDSIIDGWSTKYAAVRGASLRGHLHRHNGAPRQDCFAIHLMPDGRLLALVSDGVSGAKQSHLGSSEVVDYAAKWLYAHAAANTADTDWMGLVKNTAWALALRAQEMFKLAEPDPTRAELEFASTLTCAVVEELANGRLRAFVIGIGDSGAWLLRQGEFTNVLGGKSVGEGGISSSAVAGLPRVPNELEPAIVELGRGDVLLLGTDGIGDPLGSGRGGVGNLFRDLLGNNKPPSLFDFGRAVDFSRETFDDDRTLVAVIPHADASSEGTSVHKAEEQFSRILRQEDDSNTATQ